MPTLTIHLPAQPKTYPIEIAEGVLLQLGAKLKALFPKAKKVLVVSDTHVFAHYGDGVQQQLEAANLQVVSHILPPGESTKCFAEATRIFEAAFAMGLSRKDVIIALGGGVVGDLTGYCAATYYRGVPFIQLPTTLLAQVDSSVGGKVAINFEGHSSDPSQHAFKNAIGAFYQPSLVLADTTTLNTLPERELKAGLAEVVKYALIEYASRDLAALDQSSAPPLELLPLFEAAGKDWMKQLPKIIECCCALKAVVVARDETEQLEGPTGRIGLNLGHTFAHAFEALTHYQTYLHGEAVAIGTLAACQLSVILGKLPQSELNRVMALYQELGLPTQLSSPLPTEEILALMYKDKKSGEGLIRLILPEKQLGQITVLDTRDEAAIRQAVAFVNPLSN